MIDQAKQAMRADDAPGMRALLGAHPELKSRINDPIGPFDSPPITNVRSQAMLDVLLAAGADLNAKSRWWAGGFGLLHVAEPELAAYAIKRGAIVDAHAAARLGMLDELTRLVRANPQVVHAAGGDGQTPLHFASTVAVAEFLLDQGANIDARDVDHESTPAQYMIRDRQEVVRYLVGKGCATDILMASALGDLDLARKHLDAQPACVRLRVTRECFPMRNPHAGGAIYQWTLGWYVFAHQVARDFQHEDVLRLLMERSPADLRLIVACWLQDESLFNAAFAESGRDPSAWVKTHQAELVNAARNNNLPAVRLMLTAGLGVDACGQHGGTPLHWAAFHGNAAMTDLLLTHRPALDLKDQDFNATPLGWAIYGSEHGWHSQTGNYPAVVDSLLRAGSPREPAGGTESVREVLQRYH